MTTIGPKASRVATVLLVYILCVVALFYSVKGVPSFSGEFMQVNNPAELAYLTVFVLMVGILLGLCLRNGKEKWYKSDQFWLHLCVMSVTMVVLTAGHALAFSGLDKLSGVPVDAIEYVTEDYTLTLLVIAAGSLPVYLSLDKKGLGDRMIESVVVILIIGFVTTMLLATMEELALVAVVAFLGGFVLHQRAGLRSVGSDQYNEAA